MAKDIKVALQLDTGQFDRNIKKSKQEVSTFSSSSKLSLKGVATAFAAIGAGQLLTNIVKIGQTFQDLRSSLTFVEDGAEAGAAAFDKISTLATETQFGVEELTQSYIRLKSAGIEPTNDLLLSFASAASITQDQVGTLTSFTELFARAISKSKLELTDFDKIAERGIDIYGLLSDKFGMNIDQIKELAKTASGQKQLFKGIQEALEDTYGAALPAKLKNSSIAFSNLNIAIRKLADSTFTELGLNSTSAIESLTKAIDDLASNTGALSNGFKIIGDTIQTVTGFFLFFKISSKSALDGFVSILDKTKARVVGFGKQFKDLAFAFNLFRTAGTLGFGALAVASGAFATSLGGVTLAVGSLTLALDGVVALISGSGFIPWRALLEYFGILSPKVDETAKSVKKLKDEFVGPPTKLFDEDQFNKLTDGGTLFDMGPQGPIPTSLELFAQMIDRSAGDLDAYNELMETFNFMFKDPDTIAGMEEQASALDDLKSSYSHLFSPLDNLIDKIDDGVDTIEEFNVLQKELNRLQELGIFTTDELTEAQKRLNEAFGDNVQLNEFISSLNTAVDTLSTGLVDAFENGQKAGAVFKNFFRELINDAIAQILKLYVFLPILQALGFSVTGGTITGLSGDGLLGFLKPKASGGPVSAGGNYLVGENGPEILRMGSQSGSIIPNNQIGGGTQVTYNINAVDARSFQQLVASDPEFIFSVTEVGRRRIPGRL